METQPTVQYGTLLPMTAMAGGHGMNPDDLLTVDEVAAVTRVPAGTFRGWRSMWLQTGELNGPPSIKLGRRVVYRRSAVTAWIAEQERKGAAVSPVGDTHTRD